MAKSLICHTPYQQGSAACGQTISDLLARHGQGLRSPAGWLTAHILAQKGHEQKQKKPARAACAGGLRGRGSFISYAGKREGGEGELGIKQPTSQKKN